MRGVGGRNKIKVLFCRKNSPFIKRREFDSFKGGWGGGDILNFVEKNTPLHKSSISIVHDKYVICFL